MSRSGWIQICYLLLNMNQNLKMSPSFLKSSVLVVLFITGIVQPALASMSLNEAINITLEKNSKTRANDKRIQAMHERTKAAQMIFMPNLNTQIGYSADQNSSKFNQSHQHSSGSSTDYGFGASINLYNGGADVFNAKAAEAEEKAQVARYNSTKGFILYTKGSLARDVLDTYREIISIKSQIDLNQKIQNILQKTYLLAKTADSKNLVNSRISNYKTSLGQLNFELDQANQDFKHIVTIPVPENLQSIDEVIQNLTIPDNAEKAFQIALEKSPDIQATSFELQASEQRLKAEKAVAFRPRVDARIQNNHYSSENSLNNQSTSDSVSAGVVVSYNFSPKSIPYSKAAQKEVEASQDEKDAALDDIEFELNKTYPQLKNFIELSDRYEQAYQEALKNIETFLKNPPTDNTDAENASTINTALSYISSADVQSNYLRQTKYSLVQLKFSIQKTVGTLFDGLTPAAMRSPVQKDQE